MSALTVEEGSPLVGAEVGSVGAPVVAVKNPDGEVEQYPTGRYPIGRRHRLCGRAPRRTQEDGAVVELREEPPKISSVKVTSSPPLRVNHASHDDGIHPKNINLIVTLIRMIINTKAWKSLRSNTRPCFPHSP